MQTQKITSASTRAFETNTRGFQQAETKVIRSSNLSSDQNVLKSGKQDNTFAGSDRQMSGGDTAHFANRESNLTQNTQRAQVQ